MSKKAVLLVAFGTSVPEARKAFDKIHAKAASAFPGVEIRWAYTSKIIRAKLARQGEILDSPETALAKMMDEGFTHVAVLSLHVIPGQEFHELQRNCALFADMAGGFDKLATALPLLSGYDDMERVGKVLIGKVPKERKPDEAVVFMGHGSGKHPADAVYVAMDSIFRDLDANIFLATVEGHPTFEEVLKKLKEKKTKKAYLIPFMAVAGDHARNDMAGDEPDSWKSILAKNGISSQAVLVGIAEYPEITEVWLDHLREVFSRL